MIAEITAWAAGVAVDPAVRVAVLAGAGKVFSAGADVAWMRRMKDYSEAENEADARRMSEMFGALDALPMLVVGRLHGAALGGGAGLAAICDVAIASDDTMFGFTEAKLGILPAVISPFVVAKIGLSNARAWMATGARFDAREALRIGLVHRVVDAASLDAAVAEVVAEALTAAPTSVVRTKALIRDVLGRRPEDVRELTSRAIARQRVSAEGQEGLSAFLDKRRPRWCP